ncbi:MAG: PAS domain-containing protein [Anaerolineales bacterium]|nr:PAS domain-containing protein [Anaerolineales bacterium]
MIVPAEYKSVVDEVWANLLKQTGGTRSTNGNVRKDGRAITCEWYNTPLADSDGTVFGVSSLVEDVTERKQAEDEIKESQQKLSLLIDSSPLAVIEWNTNLEVVSWDPRQNVSLVIPLKKQRTPCRKADRAYRVQIRRGRGWANLPDKPAAPALPMAMSEKTDAPLHANGTTRHWLTRTAQYSASLHSSKMSQNANRRKNFCSKAEANLSSALRVAQMGYWEFDIPTQMFTFNDQYYSCSVQQPRKRRLPDECSKFAAEYVPRKMRALCKAPS